MERPVKVYAGSPEQGEHGSICRMSTEEIAEKLNIPGPLAKKVFDTIKLECISAKNDEFKAYGCMTYEDIGVIQRYIETLINECKQWK